MTNKAARIACVAGLALLLAACTAQELTDSMGKSLQGVCRNNPENCTVYDEDGKPKSPMVSTR